MQRARSTLVFALALLLSMPAALARDIDPDSGLVIAPGFRETKTHCTVCHSARLIIQHPADRAGWQRLIRAQQRSKNLWSLGADEAVIVGYLAANYAPDSLKQRPKRPAQLRQPE